MESFFAENDKLIRNITESRGSNETFRKNFQAELGNLLDYTTSGWPSNTAPRTTTHEGPFGFLPPPAKRQVVRDLLAGLPSPPLKELEETVIGNPQRTINHAILHLVTEVNPVSAVTPLEVEEVVRTIQILQETIRAIQAGTAKWEFEDGKDPIGIKRANGVLHLIQRSVTGDYSLVSVALNSPADASKAIDLYQTSLRSVFNPPSSPNPKVDSVAHTVLFPQIGTQVQSDTAQGRLAIPIIMHPKGYESMGSGYGRRFITDTDKPFLYKDQYSPNWQALENRTIGTTTRVVNIKDGSLANL